MSFDSDTLRRIIEGALLAAGKPLNVNQLQELFGDDDVRPARDEILAVLEDIGASLDGRGYELKQVASGWRFQVCEELAPWVGRLWEEKPQKYSRAVLETLAIVAYRQPITRGEIEDIRGVAVSTNIVRTLLDRDWIRVVGHREVPGRPAMYATTRGFLDYFNVKSLDELPTLAEIRELEGLSPELDFEGPGEKAPALAAGDDADDHTDTTGADAGDEYEAGNEEERDHEERDNDRPSNVIELPTS